MVLSHPFTVCSDSGLLTVDSLTLTPDPPISGSDVRIDIRGSISKTVDNAEAVLNVKIYGIDVINEKLDLCTLVTCPIVSSAPVSLGIVQNIPSVVPTGTELDVQLDAKTASGEEIACVQTSFSVSPTSLLRWRRMTV